MKSTGLQRHQIEDFNLQQRHEQQRQRGLATRLIREKQYLVFSRSVEERRRKHYYLNNFYINIIYVFHAIDVTLFFCLFDVWYVAKHV